MSNLPSTEPRSFPPKYVDYWLDPAFEAREAEAWRHQYHEARSLVQQLEFSLAEAQAEVALRNGECEAKSHIISDLENENSKLRNRIGVLQASPPACEGERVDVEKLAEELTELMVPKAWWCGKFLPILRRHFPPAAPKPAVQDEQLTPANEKFLDEMLASKPAADDGPAIACLIKRTDEWPDARLAVVHVRKKLAAQSAELDALRADKRRLDFIETTTDASLDRFADPAAGWGFWQDDYDPEGDRPLVAKGSTLREAIDAAIAAKEDKPNG